MYTIVYTNRFLGIFWVIIHSLGVFYTDLSTVVYNSLYKQRIFLVILPTGLSIKCVQRTGFWRIFDIFFWLKLAKKIMKQKVEYFSIFACV